MQSVGQCRTLAYKDDSFESLKDERFYNPLSTKSLVYKEAVNMDHLRSKYKLAVAKHSIGSSLKDKINYGKRSSLGLHEFSRRKMGLQ